MVQISTALIPDGTRSIDRRAGCPEHVLRRSSAYLEYHLGENPPPFTAGDLFSVAVLWARELARGSDDHRAYYEGTYRALCAGLGLPVANELADTLGLDLAPPADPSVPEEPAARPRRGSFFRSVGIGRFLWARARMIALQDPWGNALEGDIWGVSAYDDDSPEAFAIMGGVRAYEDAANGLAGVLEALDRALCAFFGWDPEASVTFEALQTLHGMPPVPEGYF